MTPSAPVFETRKPACKIKPPRDINRFKNYSDWWLIGAILKEIGERNLIYLINI